jgi:hypothetical protein
MKKEENRKIMKNKEDMRKKWETEEKNTTKNKTERKLNKANRKIVLKRAVDEDGEEDDWGEKED